MKKTIGVLISALFASTLLLAAPAVASESAPAPTAPGAPADAPAYDPTVPPPGPNDLTWEQLNARPLETTATILPPEEATSDPEDSGMTAKAVVGTGDMFGSCLLDTSAVYSRASGSIYTFGTVGAKPKTTCTVPMASISMTSTMYKEVWWGRQAVAGPFESQNAGVASLTQKMVEVICADYRPTTFWVVVRGDVVFPDGRSSWAAAEEVSDGTLDCGTNP